MCSIPLPNSLRTLRKQSGLSERDAAFLAFGGTDGAVVSRHEKWRQQPTLDAAIGYCALYGMQVGDIFMGINERRRREIKGRMRRLTQRLEEESRKPGMEGRQAARKLAWLKTHEQLL